MKGKQTFIRETRDYSQFEVGLTNRQIHLGHVAKLRESMRKHGFRTAYPIDVVKKHGKLVIQAGHHRFHAARQEGIPVKYVESREEIQPVEMETTSLQWSLEDYLATHILQGNPQYVYLRKYHESTGIALSMCIALLSGRGAEGRSKKIAADFKAGKFEIMNLRFANIVASLVDAAKDGGFKYAPNWIFVDAIAHIVLFGQHDLMRLETKLRKFAHIIERRSNLKDYLIEIEKVFNRGTRHKVSVMFPIMNRNTRG